MSRAYVVASFLTLLVIAEAATFGTATPSVARVLAVPVASAGMTVAVHSAGAFLGIAWWGRAQGRVPARRLLLIGAAMLVLGGLAIIASPASGRVVTGGGATALLALLAAVAVAGVGFGVLDAGVNTVAAQAGASAGLLNVMHGTFGLGAIGLPLVVGWADLRASFLVVVLLALVTIPGLRLAPDVRRPPPRTTGRRGSAAGVAARPYVAVLGVAMGVEAGVAAWAPTHLVAGGVSEAAAAGVVSGYFAVFTLARFAIAPIIDRLDIARVVRWSLLWSAALALAAAMTPWPSLAWVLIGLGVGPIFPTTLAWLVAVHDDDHAATRLMIGGSVGAIVMPAGIGLLVGVVGEVAIPWAVAACGATAWWVARGLPSVRGGVVGPHAAEAARHAPAGL